MDDTALDDTAMDDTADSTLDESVIDRDLFTVIEANDILEIDGIPALENEVKFLNDGCKCHRNCIEKFDRDEILKIRLSCQEMKYYCENHTSHHHIYLKGAMNCLVRTSDSTMPAAYNKPASRKTVFTQYQFRGVVVCQRFFEFVNACSSKELRNVRSNFLDDGVTESIHGNTKKIAVRKQITMEVWKHAVTFIRSYGMQNGLVLPGRIPAYRREFKDLFVLPSMLTKLDIYNKYTAACEIAKIDCVKPTTWYVIWNELCSNIVIQSPRSDLCVTCKDSILSMSKLHNLPEEEKKAKVEASLNHLKIVEEERNYYKELSTKLEKAINDSDPKPKQGINRELTYRGGMHYSFDYAQQILIPHDSQQVGPVYFLAPYKVALFEIAIEPIEMFVLYVIPECCTIGKGANSVISFLHHYLDMFSFGETELYLHADNCCGQNKNRYMLQYCTWRTLRGLNESVQLSFLPVGHTKFRPDAYFGVFKNRWAKSQANCLKDICRIAAKQKETQVVLVGDEDGTSYVPQYDWSTFFNSNKLGTVRNIRKAMHFNADQCNIGIMKSRDGLNLKLSSHIIIPDEAHVVGFPEEVLPSGLDHQRKKYLYSKIRPFVKESSRDILCPKPLDSTSDADEDEDEDEL